MPLSPAAPREHLHTRTIACQGYRRDDGLWEVEGRITDTKTYAFHNRHRGEVMAGDPVHDMRIRIAVDEALVVREVEAVIDASPFGACPEIAANFSRIKGLAMGVGWNAKVRRLLGGVQGCTHLVDLLGPMATVMMQTVHPMRARQAREEAARRGSAERPARRPPMIDSCHALAADGEAAKELFPDWYGRGD